MSTPKPGEYGEPWRADIRIGCLAIYSGPQRNCLDGVEDEVIAFQSGRGPAKNGAFRWVTDEQALTARRIVACVNALDGRDPAALEGLVRAALAMSQSASSSDPNDWIDVLDALRAALEAFGVKP